MGQFGGFYKGEKKKKKQEQTQNMSHAPVFVPPELIGKGKKDKVR